MFIDDRIFDDMDRELLIRPRDNMWEVTLTIYDLISSDEVIIQETDPLLSRALDRLSERVRSRLVGTD